MSALPRRAPYLWLAAGIVVLDQVSKLLVDRALAVHESRILVEGLLRLTYVQNRGAAFGILSDAEIPYQAVLFSLVSLVALIAIAAYAWRMPVDSHLPHTALSLVMGGAVGNLIDRARLGYVIDYMDVHWGRYHWPAFNVADAAITAGVILLIMDILKNPAPDETAEAVPAPSSGRGD